MKHGYQENRRILIEGLPQAGLTKFLPADGAFYLYADVSDFTADSLEFAKQMLEKAHVAATPGIDFDPVHGRSVYPFFLCAFGRGNARGRRAYRAMARIGRELSNADYAYRAIDSAVRLILAVQVGRSSAMGRTGPRI